MQKLMLNWDRGGKGALWLVQILNCSHTAIPYYTLLIIWQNAKEMHAILYFYGALMLFSKN